jgi:hypothetical protein
MNTIIKLALVAALALFVQNVTAQIKVDMDIEKALVEKRKALVVQEEKEALKKKIIDLTKLFDAGSIDQETFDKRKKDAAELHALNIENRVAILDNRLALIERNGSENVSGETDRLEVNIFQNGEVIGFEFTPRKIKYDRRTTSDFVLGFGLNNAIIEGQSFDDSPYQIGGSRFAELGWAWKTRVFKNTGWLRVKYGFSFMFNGLNPTDNRIFVEEGNQTTLQEFEFDLDKSKFRMDNLVIPIHFEFGPYKVRHGENYVRYSTHNRFKIGVGGFVGLNLRTVQKLKYKRDGDKVKEKQRADFNTNNFVYGLSGYIAWGDVALYAKYDLNPIFKNGPEQRNVSLGLRFDMD